MKLTYAIIIFVDIRGFTKWSDSVDGNENCSVLVKQFYQAIKDNFKELLSIPKIKNFTLKQNGDGAMIVLETTTQDCSELTDKIIDTIDKTNENFDKICFDLQKVIGKETNLKLGWGLTRGNIQNIGNSDFIGSAINRASRLCDFARPFGIVMGNYMFEPTNKKRFFEDEYYAKGIDEPIKCLVTKEIKNDFVTREKRIETPEVHIAGVCYRIIDNKYYYLIAKRSENRKLYPGLYEGCGGQLRQNEAFSDGVVRHFTTEMQIKVNVRNDIQPIMYLIVQAEKIINGICYCCEYIEGNAYSPNHTEVQWCTVDQIKSMNENLFIKVFYEELIQFSELLEKK